MMESNPMRQMVINEDDFLDLINEGRDEGMPLIADSDEWKDRFEDQCSFNGVQSGVEWKAETEAETAEEFGNECASQWHMPDEWRDFDVEGHVLGLCGTDEERDRVEMEMDMFRERGMMDVLRFLKYFVGKVEADGKFIGLGRGSSVASHVLYLMGVHKVNPLKHDLPIGEFLK